MLRMMCGRWDYSTILFIAALLAMCSSVGIWRTSRCAHIHGVVCLGGFLDQQLSQQKYCNTFTLIPRLKRMFKSPAIAKLLKWAVENKTRTNEMKFVADNPVWNHVDNEIDREFIVKRKNL